MKDLKEASNSGGDGSPPGSSPDLGLSRAVGALGFLAIVLFIMGLVVAVMRGAQIPPNARILIAVIVGAMGALAVGFGTAGTVTAKGEFPVPLWGGKTLQFTATGGIGGFVLLFTLVLVFWRPTPPSPPPKRDDLRPFDLTIHLDDALARSLAETAVPPNISFLQRAPVIAEERQVAFQIKKRHYRVDRVTAPLLGQTFNAFFRPLVTRSEHISNATDGLFAICFHRNGVIPESSMAVELDVTCSGKHSCTPLTGSWASDCDAPATGLIERFLPIRNAWASQSTSPSSGWRVPSLTTLKAQHEADPNAPTYTVFSLTALKAFPDAAQTFSYLIKANDTPVYIDGWSPDEIRIPLSKESFEWEFALENLDFAGTDTGYENISVTLHLYSATGQTIATTTLSRKYIALRDASKEQVIASDGTPFSWEGIVVPGQQQDKFSIVLGSHPQPATLMHTRERFNRLGARLNGKDLVAVLRPPLAPWRLQNYENPNYSLLLGTRESTGQVRFTFEKRTADELCAGAYRELHTFQHLVPSSVFRYEWPPIDKGTNRYRSCASLATAREP